MFDRKKAAEWFVVAWCRNWNICQYMRVVTETEAEPMFFTEQEVAAAHLAFPWLPNDQGKYIGRRLVRSEVEDNFPSLGAWLWGRPSDISRLACAPQIEKLRNTGRMKAGVRPRGVIGKHAKLMRTLGEERSIKKSHTRSAWSTCKK